MNPLVIVVSALIAVLGFIAAFFIKVFRGLPHLQKMEVVEEKESFVQAVQAASPSSKVFIYSKEGVSAEQLVQDAAERFNIVLSRPLQVVPLKRTSLVLPQRYPHFTLIGQAVGSIQLGWEGLSQLVPEVFIDTTGWAFTFPLARLAGCRVACYVHYPTVSTDMMSRVWLRQSLYNNKEEVAGSPLKSAAKLLYYQAFALLYSIAGACSHATMVNSSWTRAHIQRLWWAGSNSALVYPPVDTSELQRLPLDRRLKHLFLISVAQFRPEKNHALQLQAFALAKQQAGDNLAGHAVKVARLKMVGSCRNDDDETRLRQLQQLASELGIAADVDWCINVSFSELRLLLGGAVGGLHTMVDEHFGISVVEYMAAGVIPIANNSGGPKADIVLPQVAEDGSQQRTGFLASTVEEYANAISQVLAMSQVDRLKIAAAAQKHASQFSTERFIDSFTAVVKPLLP